jgi:hypothetical protein
MITTIIIALATALITVFGIAILAKYRRKNSDLKHSIENNEQFIATLESQIETLDNSIVSESERCNKANNKKIEGIRYARRIQRAAFPQRESEIYSTSILYSPILLVSLRVIFTKL